MIAICTVTNTGLCCISFKPPAVLSLYDLIKFSAIYHGYTLIGTIILLKYLNLRKGGFQIVTPVLCALHILHIIPKSDLYLLLFLYFRFRKSTD